MNHHDTGCISGRLQLQVHREGCETEVFEGQNMIVDLGLDSIAAILGGTANKTISTFQCGSGTANPAAGDTALGTSLFTKVVSSIAYPGLGQVAFTFSLESAEGNGNSYTEWGLFTADGDLFSRKTSVSIAKDTTIRIVGVWTLTFQ
jgi:hypothetical protein